MAGRGSRLQELLKKKEKEPEPTAAQPPPPKAPSPPPLTPKAPSPLQSQVSPKRVSPVQPFKSMGRGGVLSALLNKPLVKPAPTVASTASSSTVVSGVQSEVAEPPRIIRPTNEPPAYTASQFQRISPTADLAAATQHEDASEVAAKLPPPIASSRGRGIASRLGQLGSGRSREGSQETHVRSRLE